MTARDPVFAMVEDWCDNIPDYREVGRLKRILDNLRYLERVKFQPFVPTLYSNHPVSFMDRFHAWLTNPGLSPQHQRDLFEFAHRIAFFSFDDFTALFQSAFSGPISRWCMVQSGINLDQADWQSLLDQERFKGTWFCPITDSLLISVFHHVNEIEGKSRKPPFRELMHFGDETADDAVNKIKKHIRAKGYKRLVLLEDFVGTGGQSFKTIEWAVRTIGLPVLFCPLIIAPEAVKKFRNLKDSFQQEKANGLALPDFEIEPIFEMGSDSFVYDTHSSPEELCGRIQSLAEDIHARLCQSNQQCKEGALGFWGEDSPQKGAMVVMFSNTPNNSLSLIHHSSKDWKPLFPRVARDPL